LSINNGIDLAGKGGLVWIKNRSSATSNALFDTSRGTNKLLVSNSSAAQSDEAPYTLGAFNSNGFSLGSATLGSYALVNGLGERYASWTFREQPKFFDVVTYTGNDASSRQIAHSLGSVPGFIVIKNISFSGAQAWVVWHRSLSNQYLQLWKTDAAATDGGSFYPSNPTATNFTVGPAGAVNDSTSTYVAYLFAHNAGGFGLTGTDNVISCGSFTTDSSRQFSVNLGYEPQWVLQKPINQVFPWQIVDTMRGFVVSEFDQVLAPNTSGAEGSSNNLIQPTATGFKSTGTGDSLYADETYIYIAIRRGPMKVPTTGTSVFTPVTYTGNGSLATGQLITTGFPVDMGINRYNRGGAGDWDVVDRLRGITGATYTTSPQSPYLNPHNTNSEALGGYIFAATNTTIRNYGFSSSFVQANYLFQRAPGFFDVVCYTGTNTTTGITHNLNAVPEMYIIKRRDFADGQGWMVYHKDAIASGAANAQSSYLTLNSTAAVVASTSRFGNVAPTSTTFGVSASSANESGATYVAYLFSSVTGVSRVGSYTGTGTTQTINCGFAAGARFVLIKRTDSTGDWYVWDTARGMIPANDPYLRLNSTAAEVTGTDFVDTTSVGFEITSTAPAAINASGGTFIFLAIA
jgi:hypothetical protein